jgi:amino acid adenylation domain-containing protein
MNLNQFLAELAERGVKLWIEGDTLRFRDPKGVLTSEDRDLLVLHKAKLISLLSQSNTSANDTDQTIVPVSEQREIPLSFPQEQLWFLSQLDPNNVSYNELFALRFLGVLNIVALEQSLNKIVARHAALRTNFATVNGQPVQVIAESLILTVPVIDLSNLPASDRENEVQRLATEQAQKPFDLVSNPLIQATVLKLTDTEHIFLLRTHRIVCDGWSLGIMWRELAAFYNDLSQELPPLAAQYPDFAIWQKQYLTGEVLDSLQSYWQEQLLDAPPLLELPTDQVRGVTQTFRGKHYRFVISKPLTEALIGLSRRQKVTLFMTLLAAFQTLLYRYTGQTDLCVGSPMANRDRPEFEGLIGSFVNTLVLRTCLSGNPTFEDLLSRVRKVTLGAYAHRDLPFEKLVEILQPERCLSYTPLVVMLVLLPKLTEIQMQGLTVNPLAIETGTTKCDLTLSMENTADGLVGVWEYNAELFDEVMIARMARHFQTLLEGIVANPQQKVSSLPLLTIQERHQLLWEWNNTKKEYPEDKCIHQLFEEQVERSPDAVAVVFEDEQLTYRELNAKANQLAHYLRSLGVKPEVVVGICVERSLELIVGLLGILKAGGAYMPLDPVYPQMRLAFMLSDAEIGVMLTQERLLSKLPSHKAQVVCLDSNWQDIAQESQENPCFGAVGENLAYVIYTSGSTGKPKGVMIDHRNVLALLHGFEQVAPQEVEPLISTFVCPYSFDLSVWEIFSNLCFGGTLHILLPEIFANPESFASYLINHHVTTTYIPPALLSDVATELEKPSNSITLNRILVGVEPIKQGILQRFVHMSPAIRIVNGYGPTETTICATFYNFCGVTDEDRRTPIGTAVQNYIVYIFDHHLQPVPIGVPGELYIGGAGLARGYLNRPDLTQEKFIPNPWSNEPGVRLYKTGDKARYLPDGNIEYLGRIDNQVKIRGFRIELGEIEAVLSQHPVVRQTVVIATQNVALDKQLVAYVVPHQQSAPTISDLRRFLKERLPDYMVPSAFVVLEALPLTPNGKVDRRALRAPEKRPELEESFVAPRTPIEEMLASIWGNFLSIDSAVGVQDNFFNLGGHSLLATQVISRVRDTFGVELPLRSLFEAPTIAEFSTKLENSLKNGESVEALPLVPISRSEPIPLSFAQAMLWFLDQLQPESAFYNIPLALRLSGQLNIAALERAINEIIQRHEALRTQFAPKEGQPIQIIASTINWELQVVNLLHLAESDREIEAQQLANAEANQPFNLEREPLLRGTVLQLAETEYVLLLTMHHIISDGWSLGVFVKELTELYTAFCSGKSPSLPELPIQYADFTIWQRQWLSGEILETQLNYWKQQLLNAPALLELPTDRPRRVVQTFRGAHKSFAISQELSLALVTYSKRTGVTLFMLLVAAFQTLLYRYTGQDDIVVGTPVANRNRQEIERLIGFFVNTLVLRTDLSDNPTFEQLLNRVREVALQAYAHQDLPFEQLVKALHPTRDLSYTPLFQVMFGLDDALVPTVELPKLTVSSYPVEIGTAKFDLTLSMENTASGLIGEWEYNTDLFDEETIARMAGHFQTLLEGIVANPIQSISELPLLTETERHQLLVEWNNTEAEYPFDKCIHQLFEAQVERSPDAVAVVFKGEQLTYQELNAKANQLAHYLRSLGVKPEVLVGICVERSLEMVIGLLGILKAGGAYVPLDPAYPSERLAFMLEDSAVPVLLTQQRLVDRLPQHKAQLVYLDTQWEAIAQYSEENIACDVESENLAYVIYTSGSTGKPKGVTIQHQSLVNYTTAVSLEYEIEKGDSEASKERLRSMVEEHSADRILQFASISFDASAEEIYPCLTSGATLVLRTDSMLDSFDGFLKKCITWNLTVLSLPTAYWHELTARLSQENLVFPLSLRLVIIGGEKALTERWKTWQKCVGKQVRLVNTYGPTEATIVATIYDLSKTDPTSTQLPIGRPISNVQTYILDRYFQPVPIGVPGELYIGGNGIARGYLNNPDLTQEKFTPNPFSKDPNSRLYKTGDLARFLPDGNIEILGRIDNQVKIRGFRIELGEVEEAITQHPAVRETAVMAREDTPGNKRLVAYVVPKGKAVQETVLPKVNELRSFLKTKLPDYMVPGAFVFLSAMPLTPNGKIDRRTLPAPDSSLRELENNFVAPSTPTEETLAAIWAEVLGLQKVGIHDNFFELGGHSLLATSVISRIREAFKIELPLCHLFVAPTVASLSQVIETVRQAGFIEQFSSSMALDILPPLVPTARDTHIPLSRAQEYIWYVQQLNPDSCICNNGVSLRFNGSLSPEVLEKSINEIIRRHEILRTTFTVKVGQPVQVIAPSLILPLKIVDLQDLPAAEREACAQRLVAEEFQHHFDLANGSLIKTTLLRLAPLEYWLLIPMHHIITDAWSIGIFFQELETLYNAFSNGLSSPLPEVPLQYADFTLWERKRLNEEVLEKQLSYWLQKLTNSPQPPDFLPSQQLQPTTNSRQASFFSLVLPESLVVSIEALSRTHGFTTFTIIITALKILLFKWSGQTEILVVATTGNRSTPESERILGCFINDVILRSLLWDYQTGLTLLQQVKETVNEAINHKDIPLQKVIEAVRSKRELTPRASLSMEPPVQGLDGMSEWEVIPKSSKCELWDEEIPLELYVSSPTEDSQTLEIALFYSTDLFTNETIERLFSYYQEILQKLVEYPETKLSEF